MAPSWFDLVFRWAHVLAGSILVGGTFFLRYALAPTLMSATAEARKAHLEGWRAGWSRLVMVTSGLLLLTGLVNAVKNIINYQYPSVPYHGLVAVKLLLALVIFWISAVLAGRSASAERFREKLVFWLNVNVLLSILIVMVGGFMRMADRQPKLKADSNTPAIEKTSDVQGS